VKLAFDLSTKKYVAVKILKTKEHLVSKEALELFYTEISILFQCKHPNVVKIIDANLDGQMIKEMICEDTLRNSP